MSDRCVGRGSYPQSLLIASCFLQKTERICATKACHGRFSLLFSYHPSPPSVAFTTSVDEATPCGPPVLRTKWLGISETSGNIRKHHRPLRPKTFKTSTLRYGSYTICIWYYVYIYNIYIYILHIYILYIYIYILYIYHYIPRIVK